MTRRRAALLLAAAALALPALATAPARADDPGAPPPLPQKIVALGDSITAAWGALGDPGVVHPEASWVTGSSPTTTASHAEFVRELGGSPDVVNLAVPGELVADLGGQVDQVPPDADYVAIGIGSADLCQWEPGDADPPPPPSVDDLASPADFEASMRSALQSLTERAPNAKILVSSIPDWPRVAEAYPNSYVLPDGTKLGSIRGRACALVFDDELGNQDLDGFRQLEDGYDQALASACADFAACRYDGGAVHGVELDLADLSTADYFHPSPSGQAKIATASWLPGYWAAPVALSPPAVDGTPAVGEKLTVTPATWRALPVPSVSTQWLRCGTGCVPVGDGTTTYTVGSADVGSTIAVRQTATNDAGSAASESDPVGPVPAPPADSGSDSGSGSGTPPPSGGSGSGGTPTPQPASEQTSSRSDDGDSSEPVQSRTGGGGPPHDLGLELSSQTTANANGAHVVLRLRVTDRTAAGATNVVLDGDLPPGATLVRATADRGSGCTVVDRHVRCLLDFLSGDAPVANVVLELDLAGTGTFTFTASVSSDQADSNPGDDAAQVSVSVGTSGSSAAANAAAPPALRVALAKAGRAVRVGTAGRVVVVTGAFRLAGTGLVTVEVRDAKGRLVGLVRGTRVGTVATGRRHTRVYVRARGGTVPLQLRLPAGALAPKARYTILVQASGATPASLRLPFRAPSEPARRVHRRAG